MTAVIVVGYGSIGRRHARLLRDLDCEVRLVTRQDVDDFPAFRTTEDAFLHPVDYVVVSNETADHADTVAQLDRLGFRGRLLIEKPISLHPLSLPEGLIQAGVAYNLRFHPILLALHKRLQDDPPVTIHITCGQALSEWRPDRVMHHTYSAHLERGGGVLRDLSHELDYLLWLAGPWTRVAAIGGNFGVLEIRADETWSILSEHEGCAAAGLRMNYFDRPGRRQILVNTRTSTLLADLTRNVLIENGEATSFSIERDDTYLAMHRAMLGEGMATLCPIDHGNMVINFIEAVEAAAHSRTWIST